jgi:glycosyltransferase involved in cell wall biosynthesis
VKILAIHDNLGCGHVRLVQPLRELAKHGHEVTFSVMSETESIDHLRDGGKFDIIVGQRFAGFDGTPTWRKARTPNNRLVYEVDDDLFSVDKANWSAYNLFSKPDIREAVYAYASMSDLVTVTTETLAAVQREQAGAARVAVLPNCVPEYVLELPRTQRKRPRIGWAGGASHGMDIHQAVLPVRRFLNRNDDWDLSLSGTDYRPSFNVKNWGQMLFSEWTAIYETEREYYEKIDFDIGIAPVRDTVFGRSKSALKALEYNARGIPVIASDVQPYREYVVHGENGFLAKNEHDWAKYLRLLAENSDLRREMGEKGKQHASALTHENNWQLWEGAYVSLFAPASV